MCGESSKETETLTEKNYEREFVYVHLFVLGLSAWCAHVWASVTTLARVCKLCVSVHVCEVGEETERWGEGDREMERVEMR